MTTEAGPQPDSDKEALRSILHWCVMARKGGFLYQPGSISTEDLFSLARRHGINPDDIPSEPGGR